MSTTIATNLGSIDLCGMKVSGGGVEKEKQQYFHQERVERTPYQKLLPELTLTSKKNKETPSGEWSLQNEGHQLRVCAFLEALGEFQQSVDQGLEQFDPIVKKMEAAAAEIQVCIMAWEVEEAFIRDWNDGDDVDHNQMMHSNTRFTNRVKKFWRAENIVKEKKGVCKIEPQDIVQYYAELEATKKIQTSFKKNKVTSGDDVKRAMKCGNFLQQHHLFGLYARLEYAPEHGSTPISHHSFGRQFLAAVEEDGAMAKYVLSILEAVLYQKEDAPVKLLTEDVVDKMLEKALQSAPKLITLIKTLTLEFKFMKDAVTYHAEKPIATQQKMDSYMALLKKGMDVEEFTKLLSDSSGSMALLPLPVKNFWELFEKIIRQQLYGKFAEADANYPTLDKKLRCDSLKDVIKPVVIEWQDAHVQHTPKVNKNAEEDKDVDEDTKRPVVLMTREVAVARASLAEVNGYAKTYVLTGNDAMDRQNMYENYSICKVKFSEAAENYETRGLARLHAFDGCGWVEVNAAFVAGRRPYFYKPGFEGAILEKSLNFFSWLEQPGVINKPDNLGLYMTWDLGGGLSSSAGAHGIVVYNI